MAEEMEEVKVPYRNSRLFSGDFLTERLQGWSDWEIPQAELKDVQARLRDLFVAALPATSEAGLEEELIRPILSEILGFSYLVQPSRRIFKTHRQPDYALFPDEETKQAAKAFDGEKKLFEHAHAVADAKAWDVDLDAVGPASQMHDYILLSGVRWGVITNGRRWRLYHRDTVHELDTFYKVDLESIVAAEDPELLKYFLLFFRAKSFVESGFLDRALTESVEYARRIGTELKENVFDALRLLCQGFLDGNESLSPNDLSEIHENALILLYRLLFLMYAESAREQELLPLSNLVYRDRIGLYAIKRDVASREEWLAESHTLWSRLRDLFGFIHRGNEELGIYEYNGGLFDPARYPFLETNQIGDRYLAEAIRLLACTEEDGHPGFFDYATLDVRELGSIYEGLLEHRLILRDGSLVWEKDRSERKRTGSYYTPECIVSYIVENTVGPLVDEIERKLREELASLDEKIRRARGENRRLHQEERRKLLAGARERVLNLKILDPAMGSGHFLVSACDYLARRIAGLEAEIAGKEIEEAVPELKRTVAVRSLYGVDLNPLATELAKLSLWLHTVAKGKPLSFLDHHLRTGNSLIGATVNDLKRPPSGKSFEIGLWESKLVEDLGKAIRHLAFIKESVSDSRSDIEVKKEQWALVNAWIGKYKQAADVWLSPHFGNKLTDDDYAQVIEAAAGNAIDKVKEKPFFVRAQEIAEEKRFFHWEFEFPDVFFDRFGRPLANPGFDAVIGNPPYLIIGNSQQDTTFYATTYDASGYKSDFYMLFVERGLQLLNDNGRFSQIFPNKFARTKSGRVFRELLSKYRVEEILDFGTEQVFPGVINYVLIPVIRRRREEEPKRKFTLYKQATAGPIEVVREFQISSASLSIEGWRFSSVQQEAVNIKIDTLSNSFGEIVEHIFAGVQTGADSVLIIPSRLAEQRGFEKSLLRRFLKGKHINRFEINWNDGLLIYPYNKHGIIHNEEVLARDFPHIWSYLYENRSSLGERLWFGKSPIDRSGKWYGLMYVPDAKLFEQPKLLCPYLSPHATFTFDDTGSLFGVGAGYGIILKEDSQLAPLYVAAVLNSTICNYRLAQVSPEFQAGYKHNEVYVSQLPIRRIAFTTPKDERARLVKDGKNLYLKALESLGLEVKK